MEKITLKAGEGDNKKRLDRFLVESSPKDLSRSFIQKLIARGSCLVNQKVAKSQTKLKPGDNIELSIPPPQKSKLAAEKISLDIVYEDENLLVINKPVGMVVHPGAGNKSHTMVNALLAHCKDLSGVGDELRPGIVHRLDKDTSGLLVVAKDDHSHRNLSDQFRDRVTTRKYIAFARGIVQLDNGTIDLPIGRHRRQRQKMAINFTNSKEAVTHYKVLKRYKDYTMLELTLGTGRTHQIRAHMQHLGYPLLGDKKYGRPSDLINRHALHAATLGFTHPATEKFMEFKSELPPDMKNLL